MFSSLTLPEFFYNMKKSHLHEKIGQYMLQKVQFGVTVLILLVDGK